MKVPQPAARRQIRAALLTWYGTRSRSLLFRGRREPWAVLVAEVMAQQTQVSRVEPAWARFMRTYPTPAALAVAPTADVLRAWSGLGYNRRAVLLHRAAVVIEERHGGAVPPTLRELMALPGVGPYTARAVAAIAFGLPEAAVDTNVRRVLTRLCGPGQGVGAVSPIPDAGAAELQVLADAILDPEAPADWTQALMDLGATVCGPRLARCRECPLRPWCASADRVPVMASAATRAVQPGGRARGPQVRFEATSRWLRGRIVERLRAEGDGWHHVEGPIGSHPPAAVESALAALERDGLLERRPDGAARLPSGRP